MNFRAAIRIALRALERNKERSLLTVLGIIIGVAAVIITVAIGAGARASIEKQISNLGSNVIVVLPGSTSTQGANVGLGGASTLTVDDGLAIAQLAHIAAVTPMVNLRTQVISQFNNWQTSVAGASPAWPYVRNWALRSGAFFNDTDVATSAKVCVIGSTVASELFPQQDDVVGQTIRIRNVPFRIIGVLVSHGHNAFGMDQDDTVVVPYTSLIQRLSTSANGPNVVSALMISIDSPAYVRTGLDEVTRLLSTRHRIVPPQSNDFSVRNLADVASVASSAGLTLQILLASIATVSLIVGGIGIMNIMLVSVTERTREIGLRMAVGARSGAILLQFLVESAALSTIGGAIGVALGIAGSALAARIGHFPLSVSPLIISIALLFSAGVGIGFGFYPARKAAHFDPIVALRTE
ncbi:MAG: ABC transporter permease [Vulcanimicrobiaceae bacterium]